MAIGATCTRSGSKPERISSPRVNSEIAITTAASR